MPTEQNNNWRRSHRGTILGIAGATNSGKSTLATKMAEEAIFFQIKEMSKLKARGCVVIQLSQDDYYYTKEHVVQITSSENPNIIFYDYDSIQAVDMKKMETEMKNAAKSCDFVILEGNMITDMPSIYALITHSVFMTIEKKLCLERRLTREYDPPDEPGYFEQIVWPAYLNTFEQAKMLPRISFLDATKLPTLKTLMENMGVCIRTLLRIQEIDEISVEKVNKFVATTSCGATSIFIGTTRDTFEGKTVTSLQYEAYEPMAYLKLRELTENVREKFPTIDGIVIIHKIGEVSVGNISIVIATSSPHRREAISATEYLIDEVKTCVPIWKREMYTNGTSSWKENPEALAKIQKNEQK